MNIIKKHLPDYCYSSRKMESIDGAVIHFVSAKNILPNDPFNLDAILGIFKQYRVSAKKLIRRDGTVIELVPDNHIAYHAGYSRMNDRDRCNDFTDSFELEGGIGFDYTDDQMLVLGELLAQSMTKNQYTFDWIKGHDEVRKNWLDKYPKKAARRKAKGKPISKKRDPGDHFSWLELKEMLAGVSMQIEHNQKMG